MLKKHLAAHPDFKAYLALYLVCFIWGITWIASKEAVNHMPALQMAGLRQFLAGTAYVIYFSLKGHALPRGKAWTPILLLAVLNFVISNGLNTWGLKYISAGLGAIIGAIFPLWLVIIETFRKASRLPNLAYLGLVLGFGGILVIFYEHLSDFFNREFLFGIILSVVATWSWSFGTIYTKAFAQSFNPYYSIGLQMLISGTFLSLVSYGSGYVIPLNTVPLQAWVAIGFLAIVSSVFTFIAYVYALQHLPTNLVSIYAYINPVVAVLTGWLFFAEILTPFLILGIGITLAGVYLVNGSLRRQRIGYPPPRNRI
ncbi:MAG TPA: EamA family transporter [Saprospiraceae bacterium]|nr:EamA family transporter [Saprospiraceae bacterium]HPG08948.1 EamA family transporter [Saprospiraceae bacterium]HQU51595.1 EamA family transporter [Saprospiraceae bacterium]HRV86692.1 EamA family transporter [Saprospiraceae bacterium]